MAEEPLPMMATLLSFQSSLVFQEALWTRVLVKDFRPGIDGQRHLGDNVRCVCSGVWDSPTYLFRMPEPLIRMSAWSEVVVPSP